MFFKMSFRTSFWLVFGCELFMRTFSGHFWGGGDLCPQIPLHCHFKDNSKETTRFRAAEPNTTVELLRSTQSHFAAFSKFKLPNESLNNHSCKATARSFGCFFQKHPFQQPAWLDLCSCWSSRFRSDSADHASREIPR